MAARATTTTPATAIPAFAPADGSPEDASPAVAPVVDGVGWVWGIVGCDEEDLELGCVSRCEDDDVGIGKEVLPPLLLVVVVVGVDVVVVLTPAHPALIESISSASRR